MMEFYAMISEVKLRVIIKNKYVMRKFFKQQWSTMPPIYEKMNSFSPQKRP
jgi:hypothetical protein